MHDIYASFAGQSGTIGHGGVGYMDLCTTGTTVRNFSTVFVNEVRCDCVRSLHMRTKVPMQVHLRSCGREGAGMYYARSRGRHLGYIPSWSAATPTGLQPCLIPYGVVVPDQLRITADGPPCPVMHDISSYLTPLW